MIIELVNNIIAFGIGSDGIYNYGNVDNSVIYGNSMEDDDGEGADLRLSDSVIVRNTVVRANTPDQIYIYNEYPVLEFSNIEDGWPGQGNIDADPLFVAPSDDHYSLIPGSPCIDTSDPALTDPDGTRSDMGAYGGPGAKPVNMTLLITSLSANPGDTLEFDIILTNSTVDRLNMTIHAFLRSRADLADVRLLENGDLALPANASRLLTASGPISPDLDPGD